MLRGLLNVALQHDVPVFLRTVLRGRLALTQPQRPSPNFIISSNSSVPRSNGYRGELHWLLGALPHAEGLIGNAPSNLWKLNLRLPHQTLAAAHTRLLAAWWRRLLAQRFLWISSRVRSQSRRICASRPRPMVSPRWTGTTIGMQEEAVTALLTNNNKPEPA